MRDSSVLIIPIIAALIAAPAARAQTSTTTLPSLVNRPKHELPAPIRAATTEDTAHRGGIVFANPRVPAHAAAYIRIAPPTHTDSAHPGASPHPNSLTR